MFYKAAVFTIFIFDSFVFSQFQSEAPFVINKKNIQAEVKFIYENGWGDNEHTNFTLPSVLFRYGLSDNIELQSNIQYSSQNCGTEKTSGIQPFKAGMKIQISNDKNGFLSSAFLVNLSLSHLAGKDFRKNNIVPEIIFTSAYDFSDITFCSNLGLLWDGEQTDPCRYYTFSVTYSPVSRLSLFAESFGFLNINSPADNRIDAGLSLFIIKNFQIDLAAGAGISKNSPDKFLYFGIAYSSAGF